MAMEITSDAAICSKCGIKYGRRKGYFAVSYGESHKGIGYVPVCKSCVDKMYNNYLAQSQDPKLAARRICRKLDLYWDEAAFNVVCAKTSTSTVMTRYIAKLNSNKYKGMCYDDTLKKEGTLWSTAITSSAASKVSNDSAVIGFKDSDIEITDDIVAQWGFGLTQARYKQLETKRIAYTKELEAKGVDINMGTEILLRQICPLELDINDARASNVPAGEITKMVNTLNALLGSANLKPSQNKTDTDAALEKNPMGVWIQRWEKKRPVPEPDPELQDVDGIIKYVITWVYGHLAKMLGVKNNHCKLYEKAMDELRVKAPEYDNEDDDLMLYDIFESESGDSE